MKFLSTSVLLGILSGEVQNGYNLINSSLYAQEAGMNSSFEVSDKISILNSGDDNTVTIKIRINNSCIVSAKGTIRLVENKSFLREKNLFRAIFHSRYRCRRHPLSFANKRRSLPRKQCEADENNKNLQL